MDFYKDKTLAVVGGGLLQLPVIRAAKAMGVKVAVVDRNREAPGVLEADHFINSSTMDAEGTLDQLEKFNSGAQKIDAILTVGTDASYTVALCARRLGLPGIDPEAAMNATDKYLMRKALRREKVPVPDFELVDTYTKAVELFERLGGDCVLKPQANMGARGVRRVNNIDELKESFDLAMQYSGSGFRCGATDGRVIIEQYIEAPELSIDALVFENEIHITGVADRIIEYDPYFVETGHIMPSRLPKDLTDFAVETFKAGVRALGITIGAAKGDIKISPSGCTIGEIAARLSGGFMSAYTYPYSTGVDLMANAVRIAFGRPPEGLEPKKKWVSIERAVIAAPGIVREVLGTDGARKIRYVNDVFIDVETGGKIKEPKNNLDKSGHVIVSAPTLREALLASHEAVRKIHIRTVEDTDQLLPESAMADRARVRFNGKCFVCPDCDGRRCRGMVPGVGGIGTGQGFVSAVERLRRIDIIPSYINDAKYVNTAVSFLGMDLEFPIVPGPISGTITNLGGAVSELELARCIVKGANQAGTAGFVGDGATPTKYRLAIRVVLENFGMAVPVFKPRLDNKLIMERIDAAKDAGAMAVCMDIDAASFVTMEMKGQNTSTKTFDELKDLVKYAGVPFLLKGVLSARDAEEALKAGVRGLIVSNHGGRVSDSLIAPADAIQAVRKAAGKDALVIFDGGVRSGGDVLKAIALGADIVMIGRPVMIAAVGGGVQGVRQYFNRIANEFRRAMTLAGISKVKDLKGRTDLLNFR